MSRFNDPFVITDPVTGVPYMKRWRLVSADRFGIFVHHILRPDWTRASHDHPWHFLSIRLWGRYDEELYLPGGALREVLRARRVSFRRKDQLHRVARLHRARGVWTLVFRGRRGREWGFKADGKDWLPHDLYDEQSRLAARGRVS